MAHLRYLFAASGLKVRCGFKEDKIPIAKAQQKRCRKILFLICIGLIRFFELEREGLEIFILEVSARKEC
jgi:hypothetical protein